MTRQYATRTRLREGMEEEYERQHAQIPPELDARLRANGVTGWRIWRSGRDLFHLIEVDDYQAMRRGLADDPVNLAWQERMNALLEAPDDYSGDDDGMTLVWSLP
jgi:L-rhamnose mutarotase